LQICLYISVEASAEMQEYLCRLASGIGRIAFKNRYG